MPCPYDCNTTKFTLDPLKRRGRRPLTHGMYGKAGKKCSQGMKIDGLCKMGIAACIQSALPIFWRSTSGDGNKWHMREVSLFARPVDQGESVLFSQMNVQKHGVRNGLGRNSNKPRPRDFQREWPRGLRIRASTSAVRDIADRLPQQESGASFDIPLGENRPKCGGIVRKAEHSASHTIVTSASGL